MDSIKGKPSPVSTNLVGGEDPSGLLKPLAVDANGIVQVGGSFSFTDPTNGTPGAAVPTEAKFVAGSDGTDLYPLKTDTDGQLQVDVISSALPSGAATETTLSGLNAKVTTTINGIAVDGSAVTQPISAASLPLPSGAATETTVSAISGKLPATLGQTTMSGSLAVVVASDQTQKVSTANSSNTPLANGATFFGSGEDVLGYGNITIFVYTDQASATDGLKLYASSDNTNWVETDVYTVAANSETIVNLCPPARYFKLTYTNGSVSQTSLQLQTIYRQYYVRGTSHRVKDAIKAEDDAEVVQAVLVAQLPSGTFQDIKATAGGNLKVSVEEFDNGALGQATMANSLPVAIASDQSTLAVSAASLPLPSGAATETTVSAISGKLPATLGQTTMSGSLSVTIASDQTAVVTKAGGKTAVDRAYLAYTSTNVTTSTYTQLDASLAAACTEIEIFDSSGEAMILATGGAGSEVDQVYITPGGNGRIPLAIAASTRIAIKALTGTASSGFITINFYG